MPLIALQDAASSAVLSHPMHVLAVLLAVLALVFAANHTRLRAVFKFVPILVFCYFVPTALSNTGLIPSRSAFPLYRFIMDWLLPSSLLLLILAVDVKAILGLGRHALLLFGTAVVSVVLGGPIAVLLLGWLLDPDQADEAVRGLGALSGSWIGGGANFASIGESVGASAAMLGVIIVVDVGVANLWMIALLYFADRHRSMDARIGADTAAVDEVREKAERYAAQIASPTDLPALLAISAIAIGGTALAGEGAAWLSATLADSGVRFLIKLNEFLGEFAWTIVLVTLAGLLLSFTPARRLEGKGASKVGSLFLYLLVASIGAKANFAEVFDPKNAPLLAIAAVWMAIHAAAMLTVRRRLRAPIFFAAVGSQSCIGGAASAPIVAAAFSPSLAPVGALLAIGGYVCGTVGGLGCAWLLQRAMSVWH